MKKLSIALHCCLLGLGAIACGENDSLNEETPPADSDDGETTEPDEQTPTAEEQAILDVKKYVAAELRVRLENFGIDLWPEMSEQPAGVQPKRPNTAQAN